MKRILLAFSAVAFLSGCLGSLDPIAPRKYGFVIIDAEADGEAYITYPIGIFYRSAPLNLPDSTPRDFCIEGLVDSAAFQFSPYLDHLDAGDALRLELSGREVDLLPGVIQGAEVYRANAPVSYVPGDTALIQSPGGPGLDAFAIRAMTAEPFTMQPVGLAASGANLPLVWSAPQKPGSKMIVSLRWQGQSTGTATIQLYCDLRDDGSFAVPSQLLFGWREATTRQVVAIRERVTAPATVGATLRVISNFRLEVPVAQ